MSRKRIIYAAQAVYAGTTQLNRVQSATHSFNIPREDVTEYGSLAPIDRIIIESPTVSFETSYYVTDGNNEEAIGLDLGDNDNSALASIMTGLAPSKSYFVKTVKEGTDANSTGANTSFVYGFGNCFLTSYSVKGSVGEFANASVSVEGLNVVYGTGAVNPGIDVDDGSAEVGPITLEPAVSAGAISAIRPGDITLNFAGATGGTTNYLGVDLDNSHIQSFSLDVNLSREPLLKLGKKYAFSKELTPPIPVTLSVTANIAQLKTGALSTIMNACSNSGGNIEVSLVSCTETGVNSGGIKYILKGAMLDEQSFDGSIGPSESATVNFTAYVGGPADTINNFAIKRIAVPTTA